MAEPQEAKPWSNLEDAIADFWARFPDMKVYCKNLVDERFPKSFLDEFVSMVEAARWNIYDDPRCEVPKRLMHNLFEDEIKKMKKTAEEEESEDFAYGEESEDKVWTPIGEAIADMWYNFRMQPNGDLKSFCNDLKAVDKRFPDEFLPKFTTLLDDGWNPKFDQDFKKAEAIMTSLFRTWKQKIRKSSRKKTRTNMLKEKKIAEQEIIPVLTQEQLEKNRACMKENFENSQNAYLKSKDEQSLARNHEAALQRTRSQVTNLEGRFKNVQKFNK